MSFQTVARALHDRLRIVRLIEAYGPLLTPHQQRLLRLYYLDDLSLGEIADRSDVTRQAVFDSLRRAVAELRRMEEALQVVRGREAAARRRAALTSSLADLSVAVGRLRAEAGAAAYARVRHALNALRRAAR